jgi:hypothetical protein
MKRLSFLRLALFVPLILAAVGCIDATGNGDDDDDDDDGSGNGEPTFLRLNASAPPPAVTTASFWAKRGEDRRLEINFAAEPGAVDTAEFLKFRVRETSLAFRPNGTPFAFGDSILITVTIEDVEKMIFRFEPAGLRFSSSDPARLDLYYSQADRDFDSDGSIDDDDLVIEASRLAIWKQEVVGGPWVKLGSIRDIEIDEIEANITSFTGFAIAF